MSEAVIGVGRPLGWVVLRKDGLGSSTVVTVTSEERRVAVRGIESRVAMRGKNRSRADGYQSR
jgi:hypothetical protein